MRFRRTIGGLLYSLLSFFSIEDVAATPELGRISGAVKFVYVDHQDNPFRFAEFDVDSAGCAESIEGTDGGNPPPVPLPAPDTLSSGTAHAIAALGNGFDSYIAVQNLGEDLCIPSIFYFNHQEEFVGADCGFMTPGSSYTFGPDEIPPDARCAILFSFRPTGNVDSATDPLSLCAAARGMVGEGHGPFIVGGGGRGVGGLQVDPEIQGPHVAVQVQRIPQGQSPGDAVASTMYHAYSNRMGDHEFDGDRFRYSLPRVVSSASADTNIHLFNTSPAPTIVDVTFLNEADGSVRLATEIYMTGYDQYVYRTSQTVGADFAGSVILEATFGTEGPIAVVADLVYPRGVVSSYLAHSLQSGNYDVVGTDEFLSPVVYEPGLQTRVSLTSTRNTVANFTVNLFDSLGGILDTVSDEVAPERSVSVTLNDPDLGPVPLPGFVRITADSRLTGIVEQFRQDERGNVIESIAYNLHDSDETGDFSFSSFKGTLDEEYGGADLLALPLAGKHDPTNGRVTEILLANLNPVPGETAAAIYVFDSGGLPTFSVSPWDPSKASASRSTFHGWAKGP